MCGCRQQRFWRIDMTGPGEGAWPAASRCNVQGKDWRLILAVRYAGSPPWPTLITITLRDFIVASRTELWRYGSLTEMYISR